MATKRRISSNSITNTYIKIYNIFFKRFFVFILAFICVLFFLYLYFNNFSNTDKYATQRFYEYRGNRNTLVVDLPEDIEIQILGGYIDYQTGLLTSWANLGTVKGWTLPRYFQGSEDLFFDDISYFTGAYNLSEFTDMMMFLMSSKISYESNMQDFILTDQVVFTGDLEKYFNLSCIDDAKISNAICGVFINRFIESFSQYDFTQHYSELNIIVHKLLKKHPSHKSAICEGAIDYVINSRDANVDLRPIFTACGSDYLSNFLQIIFFFEVLRDIENIHISDKVYDISMVNEYKLLSLQQSLHGELSGRGSLLVINLGLYVDFLENLLREYSSVRSIYYDRIYRFNNDIIIPNLNQTKYKNTKNIDAINEVLDRLENLNDGTGVVGFDGLESLISHLELKETVSSIHLDYENEQKDIVYQRLSSIKNVSFLNLLSEDLSYSGNIIQGATLQGYLYVDILNQKAQPLLSTINLKVVDNIFLVESVNMSAYPDFTAYLNNILQQNDFNFFELYDYICNSVGFYVNHEIALDFCELLKFRLMNNIGNQVDLIKCTDDRLLITKGKDYKYKIYFDNGALDLDKLRVNHINTMSNLKDRLATIDSLADMDLLTLVVDIVKYEISDDNANTFVGSSEALLAIDNITRYLHVELKDTLEVTNMLLVDVIIQDVNFILIYYLDTDIIEQLFIKDKTDGSSFKVNNFNMHIHEDSEVQINQFTNDPLQYIKIINPTVYLQYMIKTSSN